MAIFGFLTFLGFAGLFLWSFKLEYKRRDKEFKDRVGYVLDEIEKRKTK